MANQLCRSTETNHHIAESITVSHGNTSLQLSLFIKPGPSLESHREDRAKGDAGMFGMRSCSPPAVVRAACNLDSDKGADIRGVIKCALTSGETSLDQSEDRWWFVSDKAKHNKQVYRESRRESPPAFVINKMQISDRLKGRKPELSTPAARGRTRSTATKALNNRITFWLSLETRRINVKVQLGCSGNTQWPNTLVAPRFFL